MSPFRSRRLLALGLVVMVLISGCGLGKTISEGISSLGGGVASSSGGAAPGTPDPNFTCDDVTLSVTSARPTTRVSVGAVPSHFANTTVFKVADPAGDDFNFMPIDGTPGHRDAAFVVPVHPNGTTAGGRVTLTMIDGDGGTCPPLEFTIESLQAAPGAFAEMVELLEQAYDEIGRIIDDAGEDGEAGVAVPHEIAGELLKGEGNDNSLERVVDNSAPATAEAPTEIWVLADALIAESGVNGELKQFVDALGGIGSPDGQGGAGSVAANTPLLCRSDWYQPDAARLDWMMARHTEVTSKRDASEFVVDAFTDLALTIGAVNLGVTLVVPNPYTAAGAGVSGAVATGLSVGQLLTDVVRNTMFPAKFVGMTFEVDKSRYFEDTEPPTGRWHSVQVTAQSNGMNMDSAIGNYVLKKLGGKAGAKVLEKHWGKDGVQAATGFVNGQFSKTATELAVQRGADQHGYIHLPPLRFRPGRPGRNVLLSG